MNAFETSREIAAPIEKVFASFSDPERLARWWGPAGFMNTFKICEFESGGRWIFTMHSPDGHNFPNQSVFADIDPPSKIVIQHVSGPKYRLTVLLSSTPSGTLVSWNQLFEDSAVAPHRSHRPPCK